MWRNLLSVGETHCFLLQWSAIELPSWVPSGTRCKQNVSPAANKQSCSLHLQRCNGVADSLIAAFAQFPVLCAWQKQCPDLFLGWLNFPGKRKLTQVEKPWAWLRLRSKQTQLLRNGSSNEYAWLAYDWRKRMSCFVFSCHGRDTIGIRCWCLLSNWMLNDD